MKTMAQTDDKNKLNSKPKSFPILPKIKGFICVAISGLCSLTIIFQSTWLKSLWGGDNKHKHWLCGLTKTFSFWKLFLPYHDRHISALLSSSRTFSNWLTYWSSCERCALSRMRSAWRSVSTIPKLLTYLAQNVTPADVALTAQCSATSQVALRTRNLLRSASLISPKYHGYIDGQIVMWLMFANRLFNLVP